MSRATPEIPAGLSYPEFLAWLDEDVRAEWVHGEITVMSPASLPHQRVCGLLSAILKLFVEPRDLGIVVAAPFQMRAAPHLSGREPDILFVAKDRMEIVNHTFVDGAADLVVEIISPESRTRDSVDKFNEYQEGGVKEYWLIDPVNEEAKFFQLDSGKFIPIDISDDAFHSRILPGFWLSIPWLWSVPSPTILDVLEAWQNP